MAVGGSFLNASFFISSVSWRRPSVVVSTTVATRRGINGIRVRKAAAAAADRPVDCDVFFSFFFLLFAGAIFGGGGG